MYGFWSKTRWIYIDREEKGEVLEIKTMQNILDTTMLLILWISAFAGHKVMKKIQPEITRLYLGYAIFICILVTGFAVAYQFRGWAAPTKGVSISRLEKDCNIGNATIKKWDESAPRVDTLKRLPTTSEYLSNTS